MTQPPDAQGESRAGTLVQILGAAVGLGAYVVLAGGVAEWARMAGAGLAASHALAAIEPATMLARGFQTLVLVPVTLLVALTCSKVAEDLRLSPRPPRSIAWAKQGWQAAIQLVVAAMALYVALLPTAVVFGLLGAVRHTPWAVAVVTLVTSAAAGLSLHRLVVRPAGRAWRGRWHRRSAITSLRDARPDVVDAVPVIAQRIVDIVTRASVPALVGTTLLSLACVTVVALNAISRTPEVRALMLPIPSYVAVAAAAAVQLLVFALASLAIFGAMALRFAARRAEDAATEPEQRARSSVSMILLGLGSLFVLPQSRGVYLSVVLLSVLLADRLAPDLTVRMLVVALVFALGILGYQAHAPQRFDRLELRVPGARSRTIRVALIGSRGDSYLVAACDRVRSDTWGGDRWTSSRPVLLRIPKADAVDGEIVSRRYSFTQARDPSLAGSLLSLIDVGVRPPALFSSAIIHRPGDAATTEDVCGGVDGSARSARVAVRMLAAGP